MVPAKRKKIETKSASKANSLLKASKEKPQKTPKKATFFKGNKTQNDINKGFQLKKSAIMDGEENPLRKATDLWFDDIDQKELQNAYGKPTSVEDDLAEGAINEKRRMKLGKFVAIDCEMVGVGPEGAESALARVSIVNYYGVTILDRYVKPQERVTDFRTEVSGITPKHLKTAENFKDVQKEVAEILKDRIVVGHAVSNDFDALLLDHPRRLIRDTSHYKPYKRFTRGKTPSLKRLAKELLGINIQQGSHSSVEDARIAMLLYRKHKDEWEKSLAQKFHAKGKKKGKTSINVKKATAIKVETEAKPIVDSMQIIGINSETLAMDVSSISKGVKRKR
ncbi:uncharacterized protein VTP21DRAFT_8631 [Calcarisporiella thermophila]|uniref:uncharacterized protein n=1 Tax=Calcarisporiella thermophila TaxID=911321 RepID=UPI0037437A67